MGLRGAGLADPSRQGSWRARSPALCTARSTPGHADRLGPRTVQDICGFPVSRDWESPELCRIQVRLQVSGVKRTIKEAGLRPPHTCGACPGRLETDPEARRGGFLGPLLEHWLNDSFRGRSKVWATFDLALGHLSSCLRRGDLKKMARIKMPRDFSRRARCG